jgi:hypothetical protein
VHFTAINNLVAIWGNFPRFGILWQEKSGNPGFEFFCRLENSFKKLLSGIGVSQQPREVRADLQVHLQLGQSLDRGQLQPA